MALIADILLIAGALGATLYCYVLGRRLRRFNDLEKGMGGAIAVLSAQVDDMTKVLKGAQSSAVHSTDSLVMLTTRAEEVAKRLEIMMAAMHDLPEAEPAAAGKEPLQPASAAAAPPASDPGADRPDDASAPVVRFRRNVQEAAQ